MVYNDIDPKNNFGIQRFSQLDIPALYQNLTNLSQFGYPWVRFLIIIPDADF